MEYPKLLISSSFNVFNEGWNGAGVYMASGNYISETFKLPIYIGSSIDLQDRIESDHILYLNRNKHQHNPPLQFSWNKHSEKEGFVWWLLESCESEACKEIEQKYLDLYRPFIDEFGGFNISHDAIGFSKGNVPWNKGKTNIYSKEMLQEMSEIRKGKHSSPRTEFQKGKIATNQRWVRCIETQAIFNSSAEAAKLLNIQRSKITAVCRKKRKTCGGFHWEYFDEKDKSLKEIYNKIEYLLNLSKSENLKHENPNFHCYSIYK